MKFLFSSLVVVAAAIQQSVPSSRTAITSLLSSRTLFKFWPPHSKESLSYQEALTKNHSDFGTDVMESHSQRSRTHHLQPDFGNPHGYRGR